MASLITAIDHLRIGCSDFSQDLADTSQLLGFEPEWQGTMSGVESALFATANLRVHLTATGEAGLQSVCFAVSSLDRMERRLTRLGVKTQRATESDPLSMVGLGTEALSAGDEGLRGLDLSFVERAQSQSSAPSSDALSEAPSETTEDSVTGLDHVVVASSDAERTAFMLGAQLGLDMRMDRSNPDWGARLMFFRCGDLIVEVFQPLDDKERDTSIDGFYGLSWRVGNADSAQQRLSAAGRDVSEVRKGRKPGTRVFTSREGNASVPTLLIEPAA